MPLLEQVEVIYLELLPLLTSQSDEIADRVTTLVVCNLDSDYANLRTNLQHVRTLPKLRQVVFRDSAFVGADVAAAFATREAAGLPFLETVEFENPRLDEEQAAHLSALMQTLHATAHQAGAVNFSLQAKAEDVPDWLLRQYAVLAGEA
ncbi:hypothetical protein AURDEDRAFT_114251, partial [Auricularia subglabra TFB-10046 SS5]